MRSRAGLHESSSLLRGRCGRFGLKHGGNFTVLEWNWTAEPWHVMFFFCRCFNFGVHGRRRRPMGGILPICETPECLRGSEHIQSRAGADKAVSEWVKFQFFGWTILFSIDISDCKPEATKTHFTAEKMVFAKKYVGGGGSQAEVKGRRWNSEMLKFLKVCHYK